MTDSLPPIIAILGPTGVGKSGIALALAPEFGAEIISADSRQVYQYLDIGTEKPSAAQQAAVRHHVIDVALPSERYTVVDFQSDAAVALRSISEGSRVAFLVGGSGQYARSVLQGTAMPALAPNPDRQAEIEAHVHRIGLRKAVAEIAEVDPATAARIDTTNARRIVRALEILRELGGPIPPLSTHPVPALILGLSMDRSKLYRRIDDRVEEQIANGLVEETSHVLSLGFPPSLPILSGLAYREMVQRLQGTLTLDEASQRYKHATHSLVRRQMTWFRKEPRIQWIDMDSAFGVDRITAAIRDHLGHKNAPKLQ